MSQSKFVIKSDDCQYSLVLPDWETDYIQGMLAENAAPYELAMLQAMGSILHKDDLVLDVGANIGNHTLYLAVVAGCRVIAFEPNPVLSSPLQESIVINGLEGRVSLICKGVGATEGKGIFSDLNPSNLGGQALTLINEADQSDDDALDVVPLDSMKFDCQVKAIKVDVEGMELDVLEGAKHLIETDRPHLFIESQNQQQFHAIHAFLESWGYVYWRTFNATPTNWFLPPESAAQVDLQQHGFEQGRAFYQLWEERQRLRRWFLDLQEKHRLLNQRVAETTETRGGVGSEVCEMKRENRKTVDAVAYPDTCDVPGIDFTACSDDDHPERALGLDFSLPE